MLPDMVGMSWMGGAKADDKADLAPLQGRKVIIWPDADATGREAGARLAKRLPGSRILDTADLPESYDAADLERDGCEDPQAWLKDRLREPEPANDERPALRLRFGFDATHAEPLGTIVEGLLHAGCVTLFYGPPKSGKSFLVTDLSLAIAAKQDDWMGHNIIRPGPVLYVACEGHAGFWKRLAAAAKAHGWNSATFPAGFILATGRPMLIRADARGLTFAPDPSSILTALADAKQQGQEPVAIVIDTVFRSFGAGNVNASPDMNVYLASLASLTDAGYAVALVHHEIKSGGTPAGSVSLIGGSDNIIHLWRENQTSERRFWQVEMAKDDAETEPRAFTLKVVPIGLDPDGRPAASCIIYDAGAAPEATLKKKRGRPPTEDSDEAILADLTYRELCNLLADQREGQHITFHPELLPIRAVSRSRLRETTIRVGILTSAEDGDDPKKVADNNRWQTNRALNRLKKQGKVLLNERWVGVPP